MWLWTVPQAGAKCTSWVPSGTGEDREACCWLAVRLDGRVWFEDAQFLFRAVPQDVERVLADAGAPVCMRDLTWESVQ